MTPRAIRRAAERQAAKLARKQALPPGLNPFTETTDCLEGKQHVAALPSRRYTGPTTAEGKAVSSLNHIKHGLTGSFRVMQFESQPCFDELRDALRAEHVPATTTESILVDRMSQHVWLSERAQRLQDDALLRNDQKSFALYLRYQTTNDRAFHRCLRELATLRRERQQFESKKQNKVAQFNQAQEFESQADAQTRPAFTSTPAAMAHSAHAAPLLPALPLPLVHRSSSTLVPEQHSTCRQSQ